MDCEPESKSSSSSDGTYIRILFNDAVYPIASCRSGPGSSCPLFEYASIIRKKLNGAGNFQDYCNITENSHPERVLGASFFSDMSLDFLTFVAP
jgi:hypothetical protein